MVYKVGKLWQKSEVTFALLGAYLLRMLHLSSGVNH